MIKYSSIALLALALLVAVLASGRPSHAQASGKYLGNKRCVPCHVNIQKEKHIFDHWEKTGHAKATDSLPEDKKADPECLVCHSTGFGKDGGMTVEMAKKGDKTMAGVQCEGCHGPGGAHMTAPAAKKKETQDKPTKETCEKCHTETHPGGDVPGWTKFNFEEAMKKVAHPKAPEAGK